MLGFCFEGVPSTDAHARFNLSPVPSVEDDEIESINRRNYPETDQDDSGEEVDLTGGAYDSTTTVTMFDHNHDVTSSPRVQGHGGLGKMMTFL